MQRKIPDQLWEIDLGLTTKDGAPLRMMYGTNVEAENRGIVVDEVSAYIGEAKVGYLKIELFPEASIPLFFPSGALNYMQHFAGKFVFPFGKDATDIITADIETLRHAGQYLSRNLFQQLPETGFNTPSDFFIWYKKICRNKWFKREIEAYQNFLDFRLNQAFIAYVSTIGAGYSTEFKEDNSGRGIASALYITAALELERQGMRLRASGLQSPEAQGVWSSFERKGIVEVDGQYRYLSGSMIRERLDIMLPSEAALSF